MLSRLRLIANHLIKSRTMSTTVHNTNKACCSIPPVASDYQPKGSFKSYAQFDKVYVTGPEDSQNAIVCVYDIFGFFPQTQQGADLLSSALKTVVYMPDFFEPDAPYPIDQFPPKDEEGQKKLQSFFGSTAAPPKATGNLTQFAKKLKEDGKTKVFAYGFCWGGKVVISAGGEGTPLDAVSIVHPAMLSAEDASKLTIPLGIYPSNDEPKEEYEKILDVLSKKPFAAKVDGKYYPNMFHGWAAARGNLKNEENKKEYEDVYNRLAKFFSNV
ncbi:hypothetical protein BD626DRAFT_505685 [Schizophyllum amplum]|uniref:Dienelactone hydrolase domain-containing protein n=1 Tax=Schizophyllum amplum TaxID=97359 RepID=A0A550C5T2_9AGAR|nr:hypothetical protein BD626DRAFT_505685 [Auriculariopsis ampla]